MCEHFGGLTGIMRYELSELDPPNIYDLQVTPGTADCILNLS